MLDPILSGSLGPDLDPVPEYNRISTDPGRFHMPPSPLHSVTLVPYRNGTGMVQSVWP